MKERIKDFFVMLLAWSIVVILLPICLLWLVWELLYTPIGYIKFKRSRYQQDFPKKYKWLSVPHGDNEVYTVVKENELPIDYLKFYEAYELPGYFLYQDILLNFSEPFFFDEKKELWLFWPHDGDEIVDESDEAPEADVEENTDDCLTVEATQEYCIEEFRRNIPDRNCSRVVFFYRAKIAEKYYGSAAVEKMRSTEGFVLYEKGKLKEAIVAYIEQNRCL